MNFTIEFCSSIGDYFLELVQKISPSKAHLSTDDHSIVIRSKLGNKLKPTITSYSSKYKRRESLHKSDLISHVKFCIFWKGLGFWKSLDTLLITFAQASKHIHIIYSCISVPRRVKALGQGIITSAGSYTPGNL